MMTDKEFKRLLAGLAKSAPMLTEEIGWSLAGHRPSDPDFGKGRWRGTESKPFIEKMETPDKDIIYQKMSPLHLDEPGHGSASSDFDSGRGESRFKRELSWERGGKVPRIEKEHFIASKNYLDESLNSFNPDKSKLPRPLKPYAAADGLLPITLPRSDESGAFYDGFSHKAIRSSLAPKELQEPPTHVIDLRGNLVPLNPSSTFKPSKKLDPYCLLDDNTRFGLPLTDVVETLSAAMRSAPLTGKELVGAVAYVAKELQGGRTVLPNQVGVLAAEAYIAGKCSGDRNPKTL